MRPLVFLVGMAVFFCLARGQNHRDTILGGFTLSPSEHIIKEVDQPFVVRSVHGIITCPEQSDDPLPNALFEIRGPGKDTTIRHTRTDKDDRFRIPHVSQGDYRFKVTFAGNQSVVGVITVSRRAEKKAEIRIAMPVGV